MLAYRLRLRPGCALHRRHQPRQQPEPSTVSTKNPRSRSCCRPATQQRALALSVSASPLTSRPPSVQPAPARVFRGGERTQHQPQVRRAAAAAPSTRLTSRVPRASSFATPVHHQQFVFCPSARRQAAVPAHRALVETTCWAEVIVRVPNAYGRHRGRRGRCPVRLRRTAALIEAIGDAVAAPGRSVQVGQSPAELGTPTGPASQTPA